MFDLQTVIHLGTSFWVQLVLIFGLTALAYWSSKVFDYFDLWVARLITGSYDPFERTASVECDIKEDVYIKPDESIRADDQIPPITRLTPLESWLTGYPLDYTYIYDYEIDPQQVKSALSRLLTRIPVIGGHFRKIDRSYIGIDHSDPKIRFRFCTTQLVPSCDYRDFGKEHFYQNFTNGGSHMFPFPEGKPVFQLTMYHYPTAEDPSKINTLFAFGASHALTDGEGFFLLMRCFAAEMRGEEYETPVFDRSGQILHPNELRPFKSSAIVLNKWISKLLEERTWITNAVFPPRHWAPRSWTFTKADIKALKSQALSGSCGEQLKNMRLSTNDVLTALFWKLRATLNSGYSFDEPIILTMAINTRKWTPSRFPTGKDYLGNALAWLCFSKTRKELIDYDFSAACYEVRKTVSRLRQEDFEDELQLYPHIVDRSGVDKLHRFWGRWFVPDHGWKGRYCIDRDILFSNLISLPSLKSDMGKGHPMRVHFNHNTEGSMLSYAFKKDPNAQQVEFYCSMPKEDFPFYDQHDITKPLNWDEINQKYVQELSPHSFGRVRPYPRLPTVDFGALFDSSNKYRRFFSL